MNCLGFCDYHCVHIAASTNACPVLEHSVAIRQTCCFVNSYVYKDYNVLLMISSVGWKEQWLEVGCLSAL